MSLTIKPIDLAVDPLTDSQKIAFMFEMMNLNSSELLPAPTFKPIESTLRDTVFYFLYALVIFISFVGNGLVCWAIYARRRLRNNVNYMIANLTVSDLLMTIINIPFSCARLLMDEWIFGRTMCIVVPFAQSLSVYVSSWTMAYIAWDRHKVIVQSLGPRSRRAFWKSISAIWICSAAFSTLNAMFNEIQFTGHRQLTRCRVQYPEPVKYYQVTIFLITFFSQYAIPLVITGVVYTKITFLLTSLDKEFVPTSLRTKAKRTTIKMLISVVIAFGITWFPLHTYYLLIDAGLIMPNLNVLLTCHIIAMSSVCVNPFIYFGLDKHFKSALRCITLGFGSKRLGLRVNSASPKIKRSQCVRMNHQIDVASYNGVERPIVMQIKTGMTSL